MNAGTSPIDALARLVAESAGGFLCNITGDLVTTCEVCSAPVDDGYVRCAPCNSHIRSGERIANNVGFMSYAVKGTQAYRTMTGYKSDNPGPKHCLDVQMLLTLGILGHNWCLARITGVPATRWATVPSTRRLEREHPIHRITGSIVSSSMEELVLSAGAGSGGRALDPSKFTVNASGLTGHVLLIDDSWVTGGHAQSAASSLLAAGASHVSILAVARVLDPAWPPNSAFLKMMTAGTVDYNPFVCPWTAQICHDQSPRFA